MGFYRKIVILVVALVAITLLTGYGFNETSKPEFCANCHRIKPMVNSWARGNHSSVGCLECHADSGIVGQIKAKAEGVKDLAVQLTGSPSTEVVVAVPPERCRRCHSAIFPPKDVYEFHQEPGENCGNCHKKQIHRN